MLKKEVINMEFIDIFASGHLARSTRYVIAIFERPLMH